jgi:hypothetical protein
VGIYVVPEFEHGFLYDGTTWTTLDDPLAKDLTRPSSISGNSVAGYYHNASGYHGFIATVPEPACMALACLGGLSVLRRRSRG